MNNLQEDKVSSYFATKGYLNMDEYKAIWTGNAEMEMLVGRLGSLLMELLEVSMDQGMRTTWAAKDKKETRVALTNAAMKVVHGVVAYAIITDNIELEHSMGYSKRDLDLSRDNAVMDKAAVIYEIAYPLRESLALVRLTVEDIAKVNELRIQFLNLIATPQAEIIRRASATEMLRMKIKEVDDLLYRKLDVIIRIYESDHEDFVVKYFGTRKLVRTSIRHTGAHLNGRVVAVNTETGVAGAKVTVYKERVRNTKRKRGRKKGPKVWKELICDEAGYFELLFKKRWKVELMAEAAGFKRATKSGVKMEPGKDAEVMVEMEKEDGV